MEETCLTRLRVVACHKAGNILVARRAPSWCSAVGVGPYVGDHWNCYSPDLAAVWLGFAHRPFAGTRLCHLQYEE
jgi:hypothetical protein